MNELYIMLL